MARLLSLSDVLTVRGLASSGRHILRPRQTVNGDGVLPDAIWNDARWDDLTSALSATYVESVASADYLNHDIDLSWMGHSLYFASALNTPYAITALADNILRFETRENDFGFATDEPAGYIRSEVVSKTQFSKSGVYWWSFSFYVEDGDPIDYGHCMVGQMHGTDPVNVNRAPITAMVLANDLMRFRTQYSTDTTTAGTATHRVPSDDSVPRDQWVNIVVEERQGTGTGYINVWRDGVQVLNDTDINLGYVNDAVGPNFQIGMYRSNNARTLAIRIANWEFGTTDLSDRISNPIAI